MECLLNKFIGFQAYKFSKKRLQHRRFPANIANFKNTYFEKHLRTAGSHSSYILHRKLKKTIQEADWKHKITLFYLLSFVFIRFITRCHSLLLIFIFCYSLSFVVIHCDLLYHSLSLVVSLVFIRCTTRCHSLSLVVIRCHSVSFVVTIVVIHCHSLSFDVTRCTTRLSFYKRPLFYIFCFLHHL